MKATLTFNLPDDQTEYDFANNGGYYYSVIWDFDQFLRSEVRYNENITEAERDYAEMLREKLREILDENNVKL
jgi:hypothetical protein